MAKDTTLSRRAVLGAGLGAMAFPVTRVQAQAIGFKSDVDPAALRKSKTTALGLYLSPTAAHEALEANPEILFVDVRDPIEITYVGHPAGLSKVIPLNIATHEVDAKSGQYRMRRNPSVVAEFEALLAEKGKTKSDLLFITCRSGGRSAAVANMLIKEGFSNVWNLTEGFEGDKTPEGVRALNGWRNAGLPWNYKLDSGVAWDGEAVPNSEQIPNC